jgi:hypothetical protein
MTDLHALITELANELDHNRQCLLDDRRVTHPLADKAHAALAEPEPEGPTDEELLELMPQQMHEDLAAAARAMAEQAGTDSTRVKGVMRIILNRHIVDLAHAALARWGNRSAPQPIPVSERLPGPGDCDAEGRCWLGGKQLAPEDPTWILGFAVWAKRFPEIHRYWLPAHALPVPEEVA